MSTDNTENRPPTRSSYPPGVKFEVDFKGGSGKTASVPKRFSEQSIRASFSQEALDKKQREAEVRRKVR